MIINNYYPYYISEDNQLIGDGTYMFEKTEFEELIGTVDDPKEGFVSTFISYGYNFTKEQYLEAYETNIIESSIGPVTLEVELDVNGHFKHITYSGDDYLVELTYTWNPDAVVDYSELDNYHIHTNECKEYIYYYSTYHRWYIDCGYSERSDFGVLESCTFENDECIYCHHKTNLTDEEKYQEAYDNIYNGNGKYEFSMRIVENDYEVNSNGIVDGYNIKIN